MVISKAKLSKLYSNVRLSTKNFRDIKSEFIENNPQSLLIFRLIMNKSQRDFAKILKTSRGHLFEIESNSSNKIRKYTSKRFKRIIVIELKRINSSQINKLIVLNNYKVLMNKSVLTRERAKEIRSCVKSESAALNGLKSASSGKNKNEFEMIISKILKENNIPFSFHPIIKAKNKYVVPDFVILGRNDLKIIIEVKQLTSTNLKRQYDLLHGYAVSLDHKMHSIKLNDPNSYGIIILSSKHKPIKTLSFYIQAEFLDTDKFFYDFNLNKLVPHIKSKL